MKAYRKSILIIFFFLFTLFLVGCTETPVDPENPDDPGAIETKKELEELSITGNVEVEVGKNITLTAVYDSEVEVELEWSSSDDTILTVSNGIVSALKDGYATVTVKDNISGITATHEIKVGLGEVNIDTLLNWALEQMGTEGYDEVKIPEKHPTVDCKYEWTSSDSDLFDVETGLLGLYETDNVVSLTCKAIYGDVTKEVTYDYIVLGYATFDIAKEFMSQFKANKIFYDMNLQTRYDDFGGATIRWESSDENIFSNKGVLTKPLYETEIYITFTVKIPSLNTERTFKEVLLAQPLTMEEKCTLVEQWINENIAKNGYLYKDAILPNYIDDLKCNLEWYNESGTELKLDFSVDNPILGEGINATINVSDGLQKKQIVMNFKTMTKEITDSWEKLQLFTDTIASSALTSYKYSLVSWVSTEKGYIPFYDNSNSTVIVDILPYITGNARTNILKTSTEYIVIHDTGSPGKGANAAAHNRYIKTIENNPDESPKSWHYSIGNDGIYQHLPLDEVGYHAGDGRLVYGDIWSSGGYDDRIGGGNRNGIGIESCIDEGSDYTYTMRIMAKLVAELLIKYNLGFDRIKQHWHFSGKNCPQVMRGSNRWNEFLYLVKLEYFAKTELKGATFEWTSLTPEIMDNTGKVIKQVSEGTTVSYKVKVTYEGETKEFTYQSVMSKRA